MRIVIILFMIFIAVSLISAGVFLVKDRGDSDRTLKALTVRIILSVCVFVMLMISHYFGWIGSRLG